MKKRNFPGRRIEQISGSAVYWASGGTRGENNLYKFDGGGVYPVKP
jgi:hypothetical protein